MPDDVRAALERFQQFLGKHSGSDVIDADSGFTVADGQLIAGEVEMAAHGQDIEENPMA